MVSVLKVTGLVQIKCVLLGTNRSRISRGRTVINGVCVCFDHVRNVLGTHVRGYRVGFIQCYLGEWNYYPNSST